ncbi:mitochondrial-type heat shock 70 [Fusarium subglutinans]|uniref:Mitochondrial-type heat shock 70 n=1 Tax=Gibberella subglutinans TaxID=42677 RepID=A0A8H5PR05_GIBSU|nr:mitochondrial-type heat shock 70 [Fusarium subglutinans]KAF5601485.1 mitochondrial-type heat shock 70 [Fusarium subglutinans]
MTANKPVDDFIIIGLDFGTTYSGIAWAYSREPEEIELVTSWDSELNRCSDVEKAPTQLLYDNNKGTSWGYSIPASEDALKWFKLLLLDNEDVPISVSRSSQLRHARELLDKMKKDPVEVIACYLRKLWNHAIDSIQRTVGVELLKKSPFHVVITLPAIWPPYAQQRMKQAAKTSGILDARSCGETKLRFISEPEAAALATIKDLSKRSTMKIGDTMVICDAGGGTVDLISYQIESISPFVVKECVKGDAHLLGGLCGGVFLDEKFLKLVKRKLTPGSWHSVSSVEEKKFLNEWWEHGIKPQFSNQNRDWVVDLPDSCDATSSSGKLKRRKTLELSSSDILSAYTPIVDKIVALVRQQTKAVEVKLGKSAKYIILVGGFGRSSYLYSKLQSAFFESTVLQSRGNKPWSAICRGAVVHGITNHGLSATLGVTVGARVARNSYGVRFGCKFDPQKHRQCDKHWSEQRQEWRAGNQMEWFLREGDNMLTKKPVRQSYERLYTEKIGQIFETIHISSEFPPPKAWGPAVEKLCEIRWTRNISLESLPTWTNPLGKVYHKLSYEIEMTCEDGTVDFTLYHEGKRVGAHNVDVQFC